jgi:Beta/Gamma crystallin
MKQLKLTAAFAFACLTGSAWAGEVTLFETQNRSDAPASVRSDVVDMASYGAPAVFRSINVLAGTWELCSERDFRGRCRIYTAGQNGPMNEGQGERVLSIREIRYRNADTIPANAPPRIELFPEIDFRGAGVNFFRASDSQRWGVRSLIVHAGTWELCSDFGARGRCQVFQPGEYRAVDGQLMGARSVRVIAGYGVTPPTPVAVGPANSMPPSRVDPIGAVAGAIIGGLLGGNVTINQSQGAGGNGRIHLFPGPALTGQPLSAISDVPNFRNFGFNDRTQSIRVESGVWEVCTDANFAGACRTLTPGDYPALYNSMLDRSISSVRMVQAPQQAYNHSPTQNGTFPPGAYETPHNVFLFDSPDFQGETFRSNADMETLTTTSMNDRTKSIFVRAGRWEFCLDNRFRGACVTLDPGSYARLQYPMERGITSFRRVQ